MCSAYTHKLCLDIITIPVSSPTFFFFRNPESVCPTLERHSFGFFVNRWQRMRSMPLMKFSYFPHRYFPVCRCACMRMYNKCYVRIQCDVSLYQCIQFPLILTVLSRTNANQYASTALSHVQVKLWLFVQWSMCIV